MFFEDQYRRFGHLSHGLSANESGRFYRAISYSVDKATELLDMDAIRAQALAEKPDMLVCGASAYPRTIDFAALSEIAHEAGLPGDIANDLSLESSCQEAAR